MLKLLMLKLRNKSKVPDHQEKTEEVAQEEVVITTEEVKEDTMVREDMVVTEEIDTTIATNQLKRRRLKKVKKVPLKLQQLNKLKRPRREEEVEEMKSQLLKRKNQLDLLLKNSKLNKNQSKLT